MYFNWMKRYYPSGDVNEGLNLAAYYAGELFVDVIKRCGDELTRENVMKQASHFDNIAVPLLWPGVRINSSPTNYNLYRQLQLVQFDGKYLKPIHD